MGLGGWAQGLPEGAPPPSPPGAQAGMMITEPTLLTSMRTMRPYAMAGEAGPERLLGVAETRGGGGYGSANIIIQLDGETIARAVGQQLCGQHQERSQAGRRLQRRYRTPRRVPGGVVPLAI